MQRTLADLLSAIPFEFIAPEANPDITAPVTEDARQVEAGGVFLARAGRSSDGHKYIPQAIANGAAAIVGEKPFEEVEAMLNGVPYAQVANGYEAFGYMCAAYEGYPSLHLTIIAVTGTDGKTTTSNIIYHILKEAGVKVGLISTVSAIIGDREVPTGLHVTNPPAHELQRYLREMVETGMTHCVLETTSMGLDQGRVNGTQIDVAVLTNVTHEHLNWHGTWENYRDSKARLFQMLKETHRKPEQPKIAVINADDPSAEYFAEASQGADYMLLYSTHHPEADLYADRIHYTPEYTSFMLRGNTGDIPIRSPLIGKYNISNVLAGIAGAISAMPQPRFQQMMVNVIPRALANFFQLPGRMERIKAGQDYVALVDFAHTPNALSVALDTLNEVKGDGRVIAIYGSAGLRDEEKRVLMARVAAQKADISIITAEDPRTESLLAILDVMRQTAIEEGGVEGKTFFVEPDRGKALYLACQMAKAGDIVCAFGKGHEQSMCFGTVEHFWEDREALRAAIEGTPLQTLPSAGEVYDASEPWRTT